MKLTLTLLLFCMAGATASIYSQNTRLDISFKDGHIVELFRQIEEMSEFYFFYQKEDINDLNHVTVEAENATVKEVLDIALKGSLIQYNIVDRYIVVKHKGKSFGDEFLNNVRDNASFQQNTISGSVTDANAQALPGVTVVIKGTSQGTVTNTDGGYTLTNVPPDATLVFSFVGMRTQEIPLGNQSVINVVMEEDVIGLEEVVAVGYGTQKKVNLTGSISSVNSEKLEQRSAKSASLALVGELSGVSVRQTSGNPRQSTGSILIRGRGTFSSAGSSPLVLVDGIPSNINNVDPNDIESVSVLKDAASSAIYGSQAANGVILIETKQGKIGEPKFNFYSYVGTQKATMLPEMVPSWEYAQGHNEAMVNMGSSPRYTDEDIQKYKSGTDEWYPNFDHIGYIWNSGDPLQHKHGLSVNGGTEKTQYMVSMNLLNNQGLLYKNNAQDYNFRSNLTTSFSEKFKLTANLSGNYSKGIEPNHNEGGGIGGILTAALRLPNTIHGIRPDGYFGRQINTHGIPDLLSDSYLRDNSLYIYGNTSLEWKIIDNLSITGRLAYTNTASETKEFRAEFVVDEQRTISPNTLKQTWARGDAFTNELLLNYDKTLGSHFIHVLGGFEQRIYNNWNIQAYRDQFPSNEIDEINAGSPSNATNAGGSSGFRLRSYFGRINYNYKEKYLFETNIRYDGSSRFPKDSRWGIFPSFSAGWRISEENFIKENFSWIHNLKLRGSWGSLGNQSVGNYPYQDLISLSPKMAFDSEMRPGAAITTIPNYDISWETTTISNLGLDLTILDGKLGFTVEWYEKLTSDILYSITNSLVLGASSSPINAGEVENQGWDLSATHDNNLGEFSYSVSANLGINHNKVKSLVGKDMDIANNLFVGYPIASQYGYLTDGLFVDEADVENWPEQQQFEAEPGLIKFRDISGPEGVPDGKVTPEYDRVVFGQPLPITTYGLSLNADYKRFYISALFQGEGGRNVSPVVNMWLPIDNNGNIQKMAFDNRWTQENPDPDADFPKIREGGTSLANNQNNDFYNRDATFVRLKNLQFGYNLPASITKIAGFDKVRLYINGENLFTLTGYWTGWDPEISMGRWYPLLRSWTFGINVDF